MKDRIIDLGNVSKDDLEPALYHYMVALAKEKGIEWAVENQYGENTVITNGVSTRVQWQYVGLEPSDYEEKVYPQGEVEYEPVGPWYWEYDGEPDFEVSCSWLCD